MTQRPRAGAGRDESARERQFFDGFLPAHGKFNPFAQSGWDVLKDGFRAMICPSKPLRLLDVGCGTGQSRQLYIEDASLYCGVDLSGVALARARPQFPGSNWIRTDGKQLPFRDESFDVVAFSSVLHHIHDFRVAVAEAHRVLVPGGRVFAYDPNLLHPAMALFRWPSSPFYISAGVSPNERPLLPGELRAVFEAAGLGDVSQRCRSGIPFRYVAPRLLNAMLGVYNVLDRLLEKVGLGRVCGSFVLTAGRKPGGKSEDEDPTNGNRPRSRAPQSP